MSLQRTRLLFATVAMSSLLSSCGGGGGGAGSPAPTPAPPAVALCTPTTTNPAPAANAPQVTLTLSNGGAVSGDVVANFLAYVNAGFYDGTVFHRHAPGFVLQGGGYAGPLTAGGAVPALKTTNAAIALEDNTGLSNLCLSVAMARTNVADSATSQFFVNLTNNTFLDRTATARGYAVFGSVTSGNAVLTAAINASCTAWTALLPVGDCIPSPNVTITRARQTR
jgi:cyclophilin family peptidyl-prolyl cis-trans isomerase